MTIKDELIEFYSRKSKHSNYQVLPEKLQSIVSSKDVQTKTRYEKERLEYILSEVVVKDKTVLDIGGNTGYFLFELLNAGAASAHLYEGNKDHADFVKLAAKVLNVDGKIRVTNKYYLFDGSHIEHYDVALLLNVLHHIGDDYDKKNLTVREAKNNIIKQLNSMSKTCNTLIFQIGYNWKGDPSNCLFDEGTKEEMIDFVKSSTTNNWEIVSVGIAERRDSGIVYCNLSDNNIERDDSLGEFLNRPLFIMKSKEMF